MILRPYQEDALCKTLSALSHGKHPVISTPTASGKSLIIAALCQRLEGRILVASHVQELLLQDYAELMRFDNTQDAGIYSAGVGRRDVAQRIIFAGIQSAFSKMDALQERGYFRYVIIDEVHFVPMQGGDAVMYNAALAACPSAQRIGLSATPYRLDDGPVYGPPPCWFDTLAIDVSMRQLTPQYLAPLRGVLTAADMPLEGVRTRAGDFVMSDLSQIATDEKVVEAALDEMCFLTAKRKALLVFCVDVAHATLVTKRLRTRGIDAEMVVGTTAKDDRAGAIERFRDGVTRALVSVGVLTTGFNVPRVDAIVLMRPSQSRSLVIQMLGRGARQAEEKKDCIAEGSLVLTDRGLVEIEKITQAHKVWDGNDFVSHDGVVYKGEQDVITYAGLTTTPDHLIWTKEGWKEARECANKQIPVAQTGDGRSPIRQSENRFTRGAMVESPIEQTKRRVWDIHNCGPLHRFTVSGILVHNCVVIDLAGNLERHAPLDGIVHDMHRSPARVKKDDEKRKRNAEAKQERDLKTKSKASLIDPMTGEAIDTLTCPVEGVFYSLEPSKNPRYFGKNMVKVLYKLNHEHVKWCATFLCNEYGGYASVMAQPWFDRRNAKMPYDAATVIERGKQRQYTNPQAVVIRKEGNYWRVIVEQFDEKV